MQKTKSLITLLVIAFLDMLGIGILIPIIPLLFADPTSPYFVIEHAHLVNYAFVFMGLLLAAYPFAQFLGAPILGQLSDKFGRRRILVISQIGTCAGYILFALGIMWTNLPLLFAARLLDGLTGGNIAVAQAAIADITPPQARARTFGLMGAVFGLGFIVGPFLGGLLASPSIISWFNPTTPFWFAAILAGLSTLITTFVLRETHPSPNASLHVDFARSIHNIVRAFNLKQLKYLFVTSLFFQAGFSFFTTFFSVYLIVKFDFNQTQIGSFFGYIGIWIIFTQAVVTRFLSRRFSEASILKFTIFLCGVAVLMHFLPTQSCQLYVVVPIFAISNGLTQANLMGLMSRAAGPEIQGEIMGINASMQALANTVPPLISGVLAASISPSTPLLVAGVVIILTGLFFIIRAPKAVHPATR